ncbi:SET domain-containing protein [Plectosphaerella cucumerina]|uniref:SET domain-containing protein n=1 Tax=Plectosphaerella cucumerina TaxID=40658 RepID=A0A8K0X5Q7_9PEZI|nr:SET domain-containing protein [Plectosphaerella cucumerina]
MESLLEWAKRNGGVLHPAVEVFNDPATGNSFRVKEGCVLSPGDGIVTCPLGMTLSYLNTISGLEERGVRADQDPFPQEFLDALPPYVVGRFFLIKQYLLGRDSFWHPYIASLPQPDRLDSWGLPASWPTDDLELLEDTNVHTAVGEIKARLKSEFKEATSILKKTETDWQDYTRVLYTWAYSIYTSRSFRPSRVVLNPESLALPTGCKIDDFSILMPLFDVGNHSPLAVVDWSTERHEGSQAEAVTLKTGTEYTAGEQVFNNYGEKTNAELMLAYGFLIPASDALHNDYVHLQLRTGPPTENDDTPEAKAAREFFFSLRPVTHPSSVTGRKRSILPDLKPEEILPAFRHVQDRLVWQLVALQTSEEQRATLLPTNEGDEARLRMVLTGTAGEAFKPVLEQTVAIVQHKALQELEKLEQSDFEVDEEQEEDLTRNQRMAWEYRRQCRRVLETLLESLEVPE